MVHLSWNIKWAFLIACCPSVCMSVRLSINFSHYIFFPESGNYKHTWHKASLGVGFTFVQMKGHVLFQGQIHVIKNSENSLTKFKNLLLKNHQANFNVIWHNAALGEGNSSLSKWRNIPHLIYARGDNNHIAEMLWRNLEFISFDII